VENVGAGRRKAARFREKQTLALAENTEKWRRTIREEDTQRKRRHASEDNEDVNPSVRKKLRRSESDFGRRQLPVAVVGKTENPTARGAEDRLTAARLRVGGRTAKPKRDGANPSTETKSAARCGRSRSTDGGAREGCREPQP
jgi:hypothetical protein